MFLAPTTDFKTIVSKIIQHPAVTIESVMLRRRFITYPFELPGRGRYRGCSDPIARVCAAERVGRPILRGCEEDRIVSARCNNNFPR